MATGGRLLGKTVLLTGASSGIGRATALGDSTSLYFTSFFRVARLIGDGRLEEAEAVEDGSAPQVAVAAAAVTSRVSSARGS